MKVTCFFVLILYVILISSCKKEEFIDIPEVTFLLPTANSNFTIGDTVKITVKVTSKSNIKSIYLDIVDDNFTPISSSCNFTKFAGNEVIVNADIIIDNYFIATNNYNISCKVTNANEEKYKYLPIFISELNTELKDIAIVTKQNNKIKVWSLGADLTQIPKVKYENISDYSASVYMPFHNIFSISGSTFGEYISWNYFTSDTLVKVTIINSYPYPYFTALSQINNNLALGFYQGKISFYNYQGAIIYTTYCTSKYYPSKIFDIGEYFLVVENETYNSLQLLTLFTTKTGSKYSSFSLKGNIIDAFKYENNDFLLFYNSLTGSRIGKYIFSNNNITEPINYNGSEFLSVAQIDAKNYLISNKNEILWYQYQKSSITTLISGKEYSVIKFDKISHLIYAVSGKSIYVYSFPQAQLLKTLDFSEEILNLHLIYNK